MSDKTGIVDPEWRPANGWEWDVFCARLCDRCEKSEGEGFGCEIASRSFFEEPTPEWRCPDGRIADLEGPYCTEFREVAS